MHRPHAAIGTSCAIAILMLVSLQAAAVPPTSQSAINKRALTGCMTKRMSADKTLSYNAALRACKDLTQTPKDALAANGPIDPGKSH
jgi:hypothetical protein